MFLSVDNAKIYYEVAGQGMPMIFLHAGVADSRQWENEFRYFSQHYQVVRYDQRGFGKSEPVKGEFSHLADLGALLVHLGLDEPMLFVGCSMGGTLALDFALTNPTKVAGLVLVDSGPADLKLDVPRPEKFKLVDEAEAAGDIERVAELETQIWFDGDRNSDEVNQEMRELAYQMNLLALQHDLRELGTQLPNTSVSAIAHLAELTIPVLVILGENDIPYMFAAADFMRERIADFRQVIIKNAGHLPNMDQPPVFKTVIAEFLAEIER